MRTPLFAALMLTSSLVALVACRAAEDAGPEPSAAALDEAAAPLPGSDAGDGPTRAPTFCSALADKSTFCADFDGERPFVGWINDEKTPDPGVFGGATIAAFDSADPAHDKVARFTIPALLDTSTSAAAFLAKQLDGRSTTFDIALALRVDRDLPAAGGAVTRLLMVSFGTALGYVGLERSTTKTELLVAERVNGKLQGYYAALDHVAMAQGWASLSLHIHNGPVDGGAGGEVSATLGGSSATLALPPAFRNVVGVVTVSLGVPHAQGPLDGFQLDVDAVAITARD